MAPSAVTTSSPATPSNGTTLSATAPSFHPAGTPEPTRYRCSSTQEAFQKESKYAAHNYHPLPIVFSRAQGCYVWDPEGRQYLDFLSAVRCCLLCILSVVLTRQ